MSELTRLQLAVSLMNAIVDHQTNRLSFGPTEGHSFPTRVHPFTCGNDSSHTILFPYWTGKKVVLRCHDCDYQQENIAFLQGSTEE